MELMEFKLIKVMCGVFVLAAVGFFALFPQLKPDWLLTDRGFGLPRHSAAHEAAFDRIVVCLEAEKWDQAIVELNRVIELDPQDADSRYLRGMACYKAGQLEKAAADLDATLKAQPDDVDALLLRSCVRQELGNPDQALADLNAAVRLAPDDAEALGCRGKFLEERGDYPSARADYEQAARLAPDDLVALNDLAWILAVAPEEKLRDPKRALQTAQRIVEMDGGHEWESLDTLAAAHAANGQFTAATCHQTGALQLAPQEERGDLQARLDLYQAKTPYRLAAQ